MHELVRRFIKTGVGFLVIGILLGAYMLVERELFARWPSPYLVSAHAHVVLVGFVMFLIMGVALWLFPRPERGADRYHPERAQFAYWLLTLATATRFGFEAARAWTTATWLGWLVVAGGLGQAVGLVLYFWTLWPRIRAVGSHLREARGERF